MISARTAVRPRVLAAAYAGPSRYSADYYIEQKVSWWWRVAEMRRPEPAGVPAASPVTEPGGTTPHPQRAA